MQRQTTTSIRTVKGGATEEQRFSLPVMANDMIIFVLTKYGYNEMESLIKDSKSPVWINKGVLSNSELDEVRGAGIEVTNFTYFISKTNENEILSGTLQ